MTLIEWGCISGLPTLWCIKIVGLSQLPQQLQQFRLHRFNTAKDAEISSNICGKIGSDESLQFSLLLLVITSTISLVTILLYGDNTKRYKRGLGIAMGSHLIPNLYMAMQLHYQLGDNCIATNTEGSLSSHIMFASISGLSFAISCMWSQCNHHTFNINRGRTKGKPKNGDDATMATCWKVYAALIVMLRLINSELFKDDVCLNVLGIVQLLLMHSYDTKHAPLAAGNPTNEGQWQDAFTPGEWMIVSTLITSLLSEYVLQFFGRSSKLPLHIVVSHSGLVGCIVGVVSCSYIQNALPVLCADRAGEKMTRLLGLLLSLIMVAAITFGILEAALVNARSSNVYEFCHESDQLASILCGDWMPQSLQWLFDFLLSKMKLSVNGESYIILRATVLGYWACVLAICLPVASMIASWITAKDFKNKNKNKNKKKNENITAARKVESKQRVIIARKYFHLVAILLFTPITWLDPDMMAISYAIAISLLLVLEMIRSSFFTDTDTGDTSSWIQFYMVFLDEKDSSAAKGGLAFTHIALIVGCAFPLWVDQLLQSTMKRPLTFLGILALGVGDSAGAIGGIKFGSHRWPGSSSRTFEGSLCMFLTMMLALNIHIGANVSLGSILQTSIPMGLVTIVEASTAQIDNLCLPIAGSTILLLLDTMDR